MVNGEALKTAIDDLDCLVYGAMATAYEGLEDPEEAQGCHSTRFRVIGDLLAKYRKLTEDALYSKKAA